MKKLTLTFSLLLAASLWVCAQTRSELSNNRPHLNTTGTGGTYNGYTFEFDGTQDDNCLDIQIPSQSYAIYGTYGISSLGGGSIAITTNGAQESWHRLNLQFSNGDCSPVSIDLTNNQDVEIQLNASIATTLLIQFADVDGRWTSNAPLEVELTAGANTLNFTEIDFSQWSDPTDVNSAQVHNIAFFFLNGTGTFTVSQIKIGDVSGGTTSVKKGAGVNTLTYYPNPASEQLYVKYDYNANSVIQLTDMSGRVVKTETATAGNTALTIETNDLKSGIYLLSIITDKGVTSEKVVVSNN